jgi:hypothetical protein
MIQTSSAAFGLFKTGAKFDFGMAELPYYPDVAPRRRRTRSSAARACG